jgi:hypothetical protein
LKPPVKINPENVQDHHQHHHAGGPTVDGANQPAKVDVRHQVLNGAKGFGDGGLVVEGHRKAGGELDDEASQGDPPQAVEDVDVGRDVLAGNVIGDRLHFQPFVEPLISF